MRKMFGSVLASVLCSAETETGTGAGTVDAAVETLTKSKKARKPAVTTAVFVAALKKASAREKKPTALELANELGMDNGSFHQRLNALRMDWKDYGFVVAVKNGGTAESLKMEPADFDKKLTHVKETGKYDVIEANDTEVIKPFPFTLADGRSAGGNTGRGVLSTKNAILAALMAAE